MKCTKCNGVDFHCHKCGGKLLVLDEHTNHIQCDTCGYEYDYYGIISEGEYNNVTSTEEN